MLISLVADASGRRAQARASNLAEEQALLVAQALVERQEAADQLAAELAKAGLEQQVQLVTMGMSVEGQVRFGQCILQGNAQSAQLAMPTGACKHHS